MSFASADAYDRFIGRYGRALATALCDAARVPASGRALDVGAGTGALTGVLLERGLEVAAVDPSEPFVAALRERHPGAGVHVAPAEALPFAYDTFDVVAAQLVVNFMRDAPRGVAEMRRVSRPGAVVAAAVWDYGGEMTLLRAFWDAAAAGERDEALSMPYCTPQSLGDLWRSALRDVEVVALDVEASYADFDDLWSPLEEGVGPAGAYAASLPDEARANLREEVRRRLGVGADPFALGARAWCAVGLV